MPADLLLEAVAVADGEFAWLGGCGVGLGSAAGAGMEVVVVPVIAVVVAVAYAAAVGAEAIAVGIPVEVAGLLEAELGVAIVKVAGEIVVGELEVEDLSVELTLALVVQGEHFVVDKPLEGVIDLLVWALAVVIDLVAVAVGGVVVVGDEGDVGVIAFEGGDVVAVAVEVVVVHAEVAVPVA